MTVSFSPISNGWTSFWSYQPEWMAGLNSSFYTWKDGNLYVHDSNSTRNAFYYDFSEDAYFLYNSEITSILNAEPDTIKVFKTVSLDSDDYWTCEMETDLSSGQIQGSYFINKEGEWYAHIRNVSDTIDTTGLSTQGIGTVFSYASLVLSFSFDITNLISIGDVLHFIDGSNQMVEIGTVQSYTSNSITIASLTGTAPTAGDFILFTRNSVAESYGLRGYYMEVTFTNSSLLDVEFFAYSSEVFKSYP
jgi:hypothetical protein